MGARKQKKRSKQASESPRWLSSSSAAGFLRTAAGPYGSTLLVVVIAAGATIFAWQHWGAAAIAKVDHKLTWDSLQVSPQPDWIEVDVSAEAFRDGSLAEINYLDAQLSLKVHRAFEMHAWVAGVDHTGKRPSGKVIVDLHYRRPVAWVRIPRPEGSRNRQDTFLPIDAEAVVLDPAELDRQPNDMLKISISELPHYGPKGTVWNDKRLLGAAELASLLQECWRECGITEIRGLSHLDTGQHPSCVYKLMTQSGSRIVWGNAPALEQPTEPKAADKLNRLQRIAAEGSLSGSPVTIDLRDPGTP